MANYVSKDGLLYFWTLLKAKLNNKSDVGHTHTSDDVTTMGTYTKGSATSAIATTDTLNQAIGKLEKRVDGKQASGTYVTASRATAVEDTLTDSNAKVANSKAIKTFVEGKGYLTSSSTLNSANLDKTFLETSGGTMTGEIKYDFTAFKSSITANATNGLMLTGVSKSDEGTTNGIKIKYDDVLLFTNPASTSNSTQIATTKWVKDLGYKTTDNDTKNTAGSTSSTSKLFIVGATEQSANPQTYSNTKCYVGTDNCLYSNNTKVLTAHQSLANYYNKTEIDSKLTSAMRYKGSKATVNDLPTTGNVVGDMWNVTATGANYVWDGSAWDETGMVVDLSPYAKTSDLVAVTNTEIDTIVAS